MAKFKRVTHGRHEGKIVLKKGIVDGIVFLAISELPYVSFYTNKPFDKINGHDDIKITNLVNSLTVDVTVRIHYSQSVSDMAFKIQESVRHNVENMTEYRVSSVNVIVKGVTFNDNVDAEKLKSDGLPIIDEISEIKTDSKSGAYSDIKTDNSQNQSEAKK